MSNDLRNARFVRFFLIPAFSTLGLALIGSGCGTTEEGMDKWEETPAVSPATSGESQVDSMRNENRRIKEQLDAMAAENRSITARNAELETRLSQATSAPTTPMTTPSAPVGNISSAYNAALDQYRKRNFEEAAREFEAILDAGADNKLADNCHYWIGESFYGMKKYDEALKHFETVLGYQGSGKRPFAQLMIGNSYAALGDKAAARDAYQKVISTYPTSELVEKARAKMDRMK